MNWHKVLAAIGAAAGAAGVAIGGTTGYVLAAVGALLNTVARPDAVSKVTGAIQRRVEKKADPELPEPTA